VHRREAACPDTGAPAEEPIEKPLGGPGKHRRPSILGQDEIGPEPQTIGSGGRSQSPDQSLGVVLGKAVKKEEGYDRVKGIVLVASRAFRHCQSILQLCSGIQIFNPIPGPIDHSLAGVDTGDPKVGVHPQKRIEESPVTLAQDEDRFQAGHLVEKRSSCLLKPGTEGKAFQQGVMPGQGAECALSPGHWSHSVARSVVAGGKRVCRKKVTAVRSRSEGRATESSERCRPSSAHWAGSIDSA
jgi:hypothetical protein